MAFFQGILPQNAQPEAPQAPSGILALLKGLPTTAGIAQQQAMAPGVPSGPGGPPAPQAPPPQMPAAPAPQAPPAPNLPLPSPTQAGLGAAAEGAANAKQYDSPWATLASSVLDGIRTGAPAFRAQKQANKEAEYVASMQRAQEKSYRDFLDTPGAAKMFGDKVAVLKGLPTTEGMKILQQADLWKPPTFSQNADGQVINDRTGDIVHSAAGKPIAEGAAVPVVDAQGKPVLGPDGQPQYRVPNPKPVENDYNKMDSSWRQKALALFGESVKQNVTKEQAAAIDKALQTDRERAASAGRTPQVAPLTQALIGKEAEQLQTGKTNADAAASALTQLHDAQALLASGQVITGPMAELRQSLAKYTGDPKAAATQQYLANAIGAAFPELKPTLGGQFTAQEAERFISVKGGNPSNPEAALKQIIADRIAAQTKVIQEQNSRAAKAAVRAPGADLSVFQTEIPVNKYSTPPGGAGRKSGETWKSGDMEYRLNPDGSYSSRKVGQ